MIRKRKGEVLDSWPLYTTAIWSFGWNESVRLEGMRRSAYQLLIFLHLEGMLLQAAAWDSACTLVAYLKKQYGVSLVSSPFVDELLGKKYCIDEFHRRHHTRPECKTVLSCSYENNRPRFDEQNTQVSEQLFSHFTKLKATLRSINWPYSNVLYFIIFHSRNCAQTKVFPDNPNLAHASVIPSLNGHSLQWNEIKVSMRVLFRTVKDVASLFLLGFYWSSCTRARNEHKRHRHRWR